MIEAVDVRKSFQSGDEVVEALRGVTFRVRRRFVHVHRRPVRVGQEYPAVPARRARLAHVGDDPRGRPRNHGDVGVRRDAYRRDRVGFVYQSFNLIGNLSAVDNVLLPYIPAGVTPELRSKAADLLKEVGLGHRMKLRPRQMSGGEQQRVAIARALIRDPIVIFADEPTGNLDRAGGDRIIQLLRDRQRQGNRTLVIVTHDRRFITRDDIVLEIEDGRLKGEPSPSSSLAGAAMLPEDSAPLRGFVCLRPPTHLGESSDMGRRRRPDLTPGDSLDDEPNNATRIHPWSVSEMMSGFPRMSYNRQPMDGSFLPPGKGNPSWLALGLPFALCFQKTSWEKPVPPCGGRPHRTNTSSATVWSSCSTRTRTWVRTRRGVESASRAARCCAGAGLGRGRFLRDGHPRTRPQGGVFPPWIRPWSRPPPVSWWPRPRNR